MCPLQRERVQGVGILGSESPREAINVQILCCADEGVLPAAGAHRAEVPAPQKQHLPGQAVPLILALAVNVILALKFSKAAASLLPPSGAGGVTGWEQFKVIS